MPEPEIENLGEIGEKVKIHTYYWVREDNISLYGFSTKEELRMFEILITTSGIGAKSAITHNLLMFLASFYMLVVVINPCFQPHFPSKDRPFLILECLKY